MSVYVKISSAPIQWYSVGLGHSIQKQNMLPHFRSSKSEMSVLESCVQTKLKFCFFRSKMGALCRPHTSLLGHCFHRGLNSQIPRLIPQIPRLNRRDGVVVRASALQSVDLGFISLVESYQKTLKNGIRSFPAWRSAFMGGCGEQGGEFACCVLGQGT